MSGIKKNVIYNILEKWKLSTKIAIEADEGNITYSQLYKQVQLLAEVL